MEDVVITNKHSTKPLGGDSTKSYEESYSVRLDMLPNNMKSFMILTKILST
jgi:hypothetical protein